MSLLLSITTTRVEGLPSAAAPPAPAVTAADRAPDFDVATAYGWRKFSDLHRERPVLLVFSADEATLAALDRDAERLAAHDVEVAAVTSGSDGANWEMLAKLGLGYDLLSDPSGHVAGLFGFTRADQARPMAAWCLVGRGGRILETHDGIRSDLLVSDALEALGVATADGEATR